MRGRARLVFSAVTVGGICAAFVAPSASFSPIRLSTTGPSTIGVSTLTGGTGGRTWRPAYRVNRPDDYRATVVDLAAATRPAAPTTTASPPTTAAPAPPPAPLLGGVWACIRAHESGGNYAADTGNGYYGAYQFSAATWQGIGGAGYPNAALPSVQDAMAQRLQQRYGWRQWSTHSRCGV